MSIALTFPGQGSQTVGMGKDFFDNFAEARQVYEEVDDALGEHLSRMIFSGPEDALTLTANAQPAIMATSIAILRVLEREAGLKLAAPIRYVAGHSLGEYTALAAAGSLTLKDTASLLRLRGEAMQKAVPVGEGAMAAILGLEIDEVTVIANAAAGRDVCQVANDNAPGQVVISGERKAVERAVAMAQEHGARKSVMLAVSAPFHSSLMISAADAMARALEHIPFNPPKVPLIANLTAEEVRDPETIRSLLIDQVTGRVRWRESVMYMAEQGVDTCIEVGVGKVLSGLAKRIDRSLSAVPVQAPADIDAVTALLAKQKVA